MAATATEAKTKAPRKIVSVDVDANGKVTRTLTEPAKKTLVAALSTLRAMAPVSDEPIFPTMMASFQRTAHAWGCDVPDPDVDTEPPSIEDE
jgi:hypothetical protein